MELGDGWVPFGLGAPALGELIAKARQTPEWGARERPLDLVLQNGRPVDPQADPAGARKIASRLMAAGATCLQLRFVHHSLGHFLEQLEAMAALMAGGIDE